MLCDTFPAKHKAINHRAVIYIPLIKGDGRRRKQIIQMGLICGDKSRVPAYIRRPNTQLTLLSAPLQLSPAIYCTPVITAAHILLIHPRHCQFFCSAKAFLFCARVKKFLGLTSVGLCSVCYSMVDHSTRPKSGIAGIGKEMSQSWRPDTSSTQLFTS